VARLLHPGAWWLWALGLAGAASRTTNPLVLLLLIAAAAVVVHARRPDAPWARSFGVFVRLGLLVIAVRVLIQVVFSDPLGATVVLPLPGLTLPGWLAGLRIGGDVTAESLLPALYDGLRLATILICIGAANSLASPTRLLKAVPAVLYELGVSVVVALTFTPQLVADVSRLRQARRLRGRPTTGVRALASAAVPVLEGALERSVALAAAMDSRGYGRRADVPRGRRRGAAGALLVGLVAAVIGCYGLLAADAPPALGMPMLVAGVLLAVLGIAASGRGSARTTYRPDPWRGAEWLVAGAGLATGLLLTGAAWVGVTGLIAPVSPPGWPTLPWVGVAAALLAMSPAVTAPRLPAAVATRQAVAA
jgi:energy-coupling factor transport system permease protein